MTSLQLIVDPPQAGGVNMAIDEYLLERADADGIATLRFYEWTPATLSLGYFQRAEERTTHEASRGCPLVRRSSGGGAIVHDRELTYSLCLPTAHSLAADAELLYRAVHGLLIDALGDLGIAARLNEKALVMPGGEPFLCFQRRAVGDVLVGDHKICGSAQRRRKNALVQHGSILIVQSPAAPELPGLVELTSIAVSCDSLRCALLRRWRAFLLPRGLRLDESTASRAVCQIDAIQRIRAEKYGVDAWTKRR